MRAAVAVGDARLSVLRAGAGPTVLLLHGTPSSAELWRDLVGPLAASGRTVVAPDLPGYGATRLPADGDHSLAGAARLLARWLEDADLAPAWVVGHDTGGGVAQILAVEHPSVVGRLTLVDSIADGSWPAPRARFAAAAARLRLYAPAARWGLVPNPYLRREIGRGFADPATAAHVDVDRVFWDAKFTDAAGRRAFERHLAALDAGDTARVVEGLRRLTVPCQLVWGTADRFQTWATTGRRLLDLLPAPAVTLLDGCGHFVPLECPDRLLDAVRSWAPGR